MSLAPPSETSSNVSVVVLGATGATGVGLIEQLLEEPKITMVYAFVRRTGTFSFPNADFKLTEIQFGQDDENSLESVLQDKWPQQPIACALSCLGTTAKQAGSDEKFIAVDYTMNENFFAAAHSHGVHSAQLISSVGANPTSSSLYLGTKGRLEERLKEIGFTNLTIYQPGILDNTSRPNQPSRPGESCGLFCMHWCCCCFFSNCLSTWRPMDVFQLAYLMVQNIWRPTKENEPLVYKGSQEIINAIEEYKRLEERSLN